MPHTATSRFFISWSLAVIIASIGSCAKTETEMFGGIAGIITDSKTGTPVQGAEITLAPGGQSTVTGSNGHYTYGDLAPGTYTVLASKPGYRTDTKRIDVVAGKSAPGDMLLYSESGLLKLSEQALDFGTSKSQLTFEISNNGKAALRWEINANCTWIGSIDPVSGTTVAGGKNGITVKIDRSKTTENKPYSAALSVLSDGGNAEVTLSAHGRIPGEGGARVVTNGLLAYYTFDNSDALNTLGTGNMPHGALNGNPAFTNQTSNGAGMAVSINGTGSQYLSIPKNPFAGHTDYSVSFWVNGFGDGMLFSGINNNDFQGTHFPQLTCASGRFTFIVASGQPAKAFAYSATPIQDGNWHQLTVTSHNDNFAAGHAFDVVLYVDGKQIDHVSYTGGLDWTENVTKLHFGGNGNGSMKATALMLDNIRIYNRTLTREEIESIYEAEK